MLLAVDVGNTNITIGIFDGSKLKATWRVATGVHRMADEYASLMLNLFERRGISASKITDAILCSVVPPLVGVFEEMCRRYLKVSPLVIEAGVKTGVKISMDNPREVGTDRIVNAVAAHHLYGGAVIVIDLGTATTFDAVSEEGDYLGGAIAPGIAIATEALFSRTAVLPRVELTHPRRAIGRSTVAAMQSGIVFGYAGLIEGIVTRIQEELGGKAKVVATGGYAELLARETSAIEEVNPDLTLIGLRLIYEMNKKKD
ncbi:MAG: type III pantothenate kinase [Dehalococcoidia bacterium]|nr:type III pantothenate kinase [Dehalococcoidia bacterium]